MKKNFWSISLIISFAEFNGHHRVLDDNSNGSNGKKKKKNKKGNQNGTTNGNANNINRNDAAASVIGGNSGGSVTLLKGGQPQPQNGKLMMPQAAAIIKVNGSMVTIRSPALQQALANKSEVARVSSNSVTVTSNDQNKKRRKKKKGANGQGQPDEWNLVGEW